VTSILHDAQGLPYVAPGPTFPFTPKQLPLSVVFAAFAPGFVALWLAGVVLILPVLPGMAARVALARVVLAAGWAPLWLVGRGRYRRAVAAAQQAWTTLEAADLAAAEQALLAAAQRSPRWRRRDTLVEWLWWVRLRRGDPEGALEAAPARTRLTNVRRDPARFASAGEQLALAFALTGELAAARSWLQAGALSGHEPSPLVHLALALRGTEPAFDPSAWLQEQWPRVELSCDARTGRELRLLLAFAAERDGRGDLESWLAAARPSRPGEYDCWGARWPELRAFLERRGFTGAVASTDGSPAQPPT